MGVSFSLNEVPHRFFMTRQIIYERERGERFHLDKIRCALFSKNEIA
jgi:hypothetical protein